MSYIGKSPTHNDAVGLLNEKNLDFLGIEYAIGGDRLQVTQPSNDDNIKSRKNFILFFTFHLFLRIPFTMRYQVVCIVAELSGPIVLPIAMGARSYDWY
jgi:hypothetical protein